MKNLKNYYDVIIIGAGPAGLMSAKTLSKSKHSVLVIEKDNDFNINKTCAGGLTNKSLELLNFKISENIFNEIYLVIEDNLTKLKARNIVGTFERKKLYEYLTKDFTDNIKIVFNTKINEIKNNFIKINSKKKINFKYLIGADGSNSIVRNHLKLKNNKILLALNYNIIKNIQLFKNIQFYFDVKYFGSGYAWIFPHKKYISIGCCADPLLLISGNDLNLNFHKWLVDMKIDYHNTKLGSGIINYDYQGYQFKNIFLSGDAGGFANGLTGEGIYYALISADEIAKKILNPKYSCPKIQNLLMLKTKQEKLLKYISKNAYLTKVLYNIMNNRLVNHKFYDKIIKEFAYEYNKA